MLSHNSHNDCTHRRLNNQFEILKKITQLAHSNLYKKKRKEKPIVCLKYRSEVA